MQKIGQLSSNEKSELIGKLNAFPGHRVKLMSIFQAAMKVI